MVRKVTPNGQRIKELRTSQEYELTQAKFAHLCNISERKLRRIETESRETDYPTMIRIAEKLGVALEQIVHSVSGPKLVTRGKELTLGVSEFLCVRLGRSHPPLGERL